MEQDERDAPAAAGPRGQHMLYILPQIGESIPLVLATALERVDAELREPQLLVVTATAEGAVAVANAAIETTMAAGQVTPRVLTATSAQRALRVAREGGAQIVTGPPGEIAALLQASALKLGALRTLVFAWVDDLVAADPDAEGQIASIMADVPKSAARILVTAQANARADELVERYLRRPRRMTVTEESVENAPGALALQYVSVAPSARAGALRRLLDALDPGSAAIYAHNADSERDVTRVIRSLAYPNEGAIRVTRGVDGASEPPALLVLYDLPLTRRELVEMVGNAAPQIVALTQPRQLATLRGYAAGGSVRPLTLPGPLADARRREHNLQSELRAALADGAPASELLVLEPLLEEFDGVELAAAALRLLKRAREAKARVETRPEVREEARESKEETPTHEFTRVFMTIGSMDGAKAGDLVGAITNECGITRTEIGKVDVRDNHSLVDIATPVVELVLQKINGVAVRGRRIVARLERDRAGTRDAGADTRPPRDSGRPARPDRGGSDRGDRPRSPDRGSTDRGDRPRGPGGKGRDARPAFGSRDAGRGDRGGANRPRSPRGEHGPRPGGGRPERTGRLPSDEPGGHRDADRGGRTARDEPRDWAARGEQMRRSRRGGRDGA